MKVIDWIAYDISESYPESICGFGGFFNNGMRWNDFIKKVEEVKKPYYEAIRQEVIEIGIKLNGQAHQYSNCGVPMFEDNTVATFSFRGWGDLMAAIWSEHEDKDYNYMDFYC